MLVLVVGPSGAGKDTLLRLAREGLSGEARVRFVRRVITRPADAGGEDHEAVTGAEFGRRNHALQWTAHGLRYGIPTQIGADLARGHVVVANVSRGVIAEAAARFPVRVVLVTAPPEVLAARLAGRGRETAADIAARLARDVALPEGVPTTTIVNDGAPEAGAARLIALLREWAAGSGT
ncbi:phosphonate metabolism protein/1,5-bisphosphokinase (PRPP-forming) PhnN [Rhodopila sp.]|jgi:ribose 1,5-bisphosphokinase|uniref:phosphonate metabolism protein/1,5-bisphosphokinase (PRPP-forming) PhnN n=1 Tax=Rhodopila sp. TaxID=2480087 RepID=UPI002BA068BC|nr:phosphonate metabolism protein/1,5-bisphosphokinase (PRPP-forming) PhnN [Rhodopila sp.]HVZ08350.1 phosphonate metabolism protein/1,5-bisphosphokinase (PRPP-forming) PhnN [Rhodopila sp.]